ncbi:similar to PHD finger domain protein [Plenodomus lingam JN3]|uniref:Chromatin modification-related protein n=1 Tax=Leptosphaeria maculans (strain JN3 / isolate v23.1.3 / race Av1-4-5-6-7-8) TaxID=985895 RepID=E4ZIX1_LEPMJ|nr:similar to PHD finger domain protein [Plenodomus lingam JN3]CBX91241.1 similar to PHD finger domain protein [Plenodomus lingam JN3]
MAIAEDAATVLEQFIHDVANLPAEITHLYEEVQAKDAQIQELRSAIQQRDNSLQKFIKLNGSLVQNPKEDPYSKVILSNYEKAQILQEEKIGLAEKAASLLDRHVKRLDIKLRDLQSDGSIPNDPQMPSLLKESPGNLVPPSSITNTGANTPLLPVSGNHGGGAPNLAQAAAIARITNATSVNLNSRMNPSLQNMQTQALLNQQRLTNAQGASQGNARQERESSAGSDSKRRRPTGSIGPLPTVASHLGRQSSVGPGTPKPSTPGSRAGSVGPRPPKHALTVKKAKPQQPLRKAALTAKAPMNKKRRKGGSRASPSTTADDESVASEAGTEDEEMSGVGGGDADEDESDDTKYCTCQRVSFGDMVACDNDNCQYQWFHWECVGIKEEPLGDWLCPDCRKQPLSKIKRAR